MHYCFQFGLVNLLSFIYDNNIIAKKDIPLEGNPLSNLALSLSQFTDLKEVSLLSFSYLLEKCYSDFSWSHRVKLLTNSMSSDDLDNYMNNFSDKQGFCYETITKYVDRLGRNTLMLLTQYNQEKGIDLFIDYIIKSLDEQDKKKSSKSNINNNIDNISNYYLENELITYLNKINKINKISKHDKIISSDTNTNLVHSNDNYELIDEINFLNRKLIHTIQFIFKILEEKDFDNKTIISYCRLYNYPQLVNQIAEKLVEHYIEDFNKAIINYFKTEDYIIKEKRIKDLINLVTTYFYVSFFPTIKQNYSIIDKNVKFNLVKTSLIEEEFSLLKHLFGFIIEETINISYSNVNTTIGKNESNKDDKNDNEVSKKVKLNSSSDTSISSIIYSYSNPFLEDLINHINSGIEESYNEIKENVLFSQRKVNNVLLVSKCFKFIKKTYKTVNTDKAFISKDFIKNSNDTTSFGEIYFSNNSHYHFLVNSINYYLNTKQTTTIIRSNKNLNKNNTNNISDTSNTNLNNISHSSSNKEVTLLSTSITQSQLRTLFDLLNFNTNNRNFNNAKASSKTLLITSSLCLQHTCLLYNNQKERIQARKMRHENSDRLISLLNQQTGTLSNKYFSSMLYKSISTTQARISDITRVHNYKYIKSIKTTSEKLSKLRNNNLESIKFDNDTDINSKTYITAMTTAQCAIKAVESVYQGQFKNAFVACRPPGHHAGHLGKAGTNMEDLNHTQGFCYINNIAVAAAYLRNKYNSKIAIIDFDVHHGNGTEELVRNLNENKIIYKKESLIGTFTQELDICTPWSDDADKKNVLFISIHVYLEDDKESFYPSMGSRNNNTLESDTDVYPGGVLNIPLNCETKYSNKYRSMFLNEVISRLHLFKPEFILVSAGFDGHENEFINGEHSRINEFDYYWITKELCSVADKYCDGKIVSLLEGGYNVDSGVVSSFAQSVAYHVNALTQYCNFNSNKEVDCNNSNNNTDSKVDNYDCLNNSKRNQSMFGNTRKDTFYDLYKIDDTLINGFNSNNNATISDRSKIIYSDLNNTLDNTSSKEEEEIETITSSFLNQKRKKQLLKDSEAFNKSKEIKKIIYGYKYPEDANIVQQRETYVRKLRARKPVDYNAANSNTQNSNKKNSSIEEKEKEKENNELSLKEKPAKC